MCRGLERLVPPHPAEPTLLGFSPSCTVEILVRVGGRAGAASNLLAGLVPEDLKQSSHDEAAGNTHAKDSNHGKVALAVLVRALGGVLGPAGV